MAVDLAMAELLPVSAGWMAKSVPGSPVQIAVIEATKQAALDRFNQATKAWTRLLDQADEE